MNSKEEEIEHFIYAYMIDRKENGHERSGVGYTTAGFAVAYAFLQIAAALNRIADSVKEGSRDE